ncbi:hypothetical protein OY671_007336, partial [Metschnikowia pulcherrima]
MGREENKAGWSGLGFVTFQCYGSNYSVQFEDN